MAVSEILGITDCYEAFCINETADYIYDRLMKQARNKDNEPNGNDYLKRLAKPKRK